jgi:hypothetical protein
MDRPDLVDVVADKLAELAAERRAGGDRLAEAEAAEGYSLADALGEVRTVAAVLADDDGAGGAVAVPGRHPPHRGSGLVPVHARQGPPLGRGPTALPGRRAA